jgi:peptidyl-prolyl cis-trans isomerase A (cyclophilin A)
MLLRPARALLASLAVLCLGAAAIACSKPDEIVGKDPAAKPGGGGSANCSVETPSGQVDKPISLAAATQCLGSGQLVADIETDGGTLTCKLFEDKAPIAVANFVGLARGLQSFRDPVNGQWVKRKAYDGTSFHRIIKGFMIQGGDPAGAGTGDPGYVFPDEMWGQPHDRAGYLCMANKGPNTNGMQFFITDAAASWLDKSYTIFGDCSPVDVVHKIAVTPVVGDRPMNKPKINKVTIRRG